MSSPAVGVPHCFGVYLCFTVSPFRCIRLTSQARYVRVVLPRRALHASCASPWHSFAKHCVLETCFLLTVPFRGMLLTPQGGPRCLAPTAHQIPVYLMVFSTFLCRAFTAHHPEHIALASVSQLPAKPRVPTQLIVSRHPAMGHCLTPRVEPFQALLGPCVIPHLRRHMALLTSWLVPCPLLRQGQAEVEHGVVVAGDVAPEDPDLAVVDLPPMATPLAFHPHRVHATFGETAGIKRDHAIGFPQSLDHVGDQDLDQRAVIPGDGTEEVLENLSLDIDERRDVLGILPGQVGQ